MKKLLLLVFFFSMQFSFLNSANALSARSLAEVDAYWCEALGGLYISGLYGEFCEWEFAD